jgi:hypothetical protein
VSMPLMNVNQAQNRLLNDGLLSLGLSAVLLAPKWANSDVTFNDAALTLTSSDVVKAPFQGLRRQLPELGSANLFEVDGSPVSGAGTVFSLHPGAAARLEVLVAARLGNAAGSIRPVPHTLVVRGATGQDADAWFGVGEDISTAGTFSFHDGRGLIICPIAVAALFDNLATWRQALAPDGWLPNNVPGAVAGIAAKPPGGVVVHVVDPHGWRFDPAQAPDVETVTVLDASNNPIPGKVEANGLATLQTLANESIGVMNSKTGLSVTPQRIALGWERNSTLGAGPLKPPPLPANVTLSRDFLRVVAVDLPWHLLGNRTASLGNQGPGTPVSPGQEIQGVPADDGKLQSLCVPIVRDQVNIEFLADGVDVLGAAGNDVLGPWWNPPPPQPGLYFVISPTIDGQVGVPPAPQPGLSPDPATHWPLSPAPPGGPAFALTGPPTSQLSADWSSSQDVTITFPGGTIPLGAHVRVYPRRFQVIKSIGPDPSFLRGDGGAAIVTNAQPFSITLANPLALPANDNQPPGSTLVFDLAITDRNGNRRTFGNIALPIGNGAPPPALDPFGAPDPLSAPAFPFNMASIAPSRVFGITGGPAAPPGQPPLGNVVALLRWLANETPPRVGPRLPTMARFPTLVVAGLGPTNQATALTWSAVVTGGWWSRETRSASQFLANPGNPHGPDVLAPGVKVNGALAFDVATIAMRRVQPIVPLPNNVPGQGNQVGGWIPFVGSNAWIAPNPGNQPTDTCAGAVLRTVAMGCETPELSPAAVQIPQSPTPVSNLIATVATALNVPPPPGPWLANETRIGNEIIREFNVSKFGQRDALWALWRAVRQAREMVVIVSPQFCATARPPGSPPTHEIDLVGELAKQMAEQTSLRVVICTPRLPDMVPAYGGWVREALAARKEAIDQLKLVDPDRVVAFHPVGFPGRAALIRTTSVVVDDVWALVGTSHWRRRGLTFDEGVDVVGLDKKFDATGVSAKIRRYRRSLLAGILQTPVSPLAPPPPPPPMPPAADWVRLSGPASTYHLIRDLVDQGGLGRLLPFWPGPDDPWPAELTQSHDVADPDGASDANYWQYFVDLIGESPDPD